MAKKTIWQIGIIGAGMIAKKHARDLLATGRCKIPVVADVLPKAGRAFAEMFGIPKSVADYAELLADPGVDAVVIATPPSTHKAIFLDAVAAGKHVLLEKPMAIRATDIRTMLAAARRHPKLVVCEASCRHARLQPKFAFVKRLVDSGALGDVYYVHHNAVNRRGRPGIEYHPGAHWFLDKKIAGGGPSMDWGVYDLSFHLGVLGDAHTLKSVLAVGKNGLDEMSRRIPRFDVEEHLAAFMKFDKGLTYYWERSTNANNQAKNETRIYGTKGGLTLSFPSWDEPAVTFYSNTARGKAVTKILKVPMKGHKDDNRPLMDHFLDCLEGKAKPAMPLALAAKNLDIILKVLAAAG
jgi:predicted dehydrogenase